MSEKYVLNSDGDPVPCDDLLMWGMWMENRDRRRIARTEFEGGYVSAVFLGLDHNFGLGGPPVLWETMIFGGPHAGYQERYTSKADAEAGHAVAVSMATSGIK